LIINNLSLVHGRNINLNNQLPASSGRKGGTTDILHLASTFVESLEWDDEFFKMSGTGYRSRYSHTQYPRARIQIQDPPDNEFEVEKIVGERWTKDGKEFCLRWLHFKSPSPEMA
jgi:hypothetical protein